MSRLCQYPSPVRGQYKPRELGLSPAGNSMG